MSGIPAPDYLPKLPAKTDYGIGIVGCGGIVKGTIGLMHSYLHGDAPETYKPHFVIPSGARDLPECGKRGFAIPFGMLSEDSQVRVPADPSPRSG